MSGKELGDPHAKFVRRPPARIDNLWTLADITQQLYLDLPDPDASFAQLAANTAAINS